MLRTELPFRWAWAAPALFLLALEGVLLGGGALAGAAQAPSTGSGQAQTRSFTLYVRDGWLPMPDGNQVYVWSFTDDPNGPPQVPGPPIVVDEGDVVEVTLINDRDPTTTPLLALGEGHTIHLHGLDTATEHDGVPETHEPGLVRQGGSYTYRFVATHAGTYFYHCHQNNVEHQQMGMYGPLVVRAAGGVKTAYTGGPAFDREETLVLAEFDAEGHEAARRAVKEGGEPYNWLRFNPDYVLINDRAWAQSAEVSLALDARPGERVLARVVNAGYAAHAIYAGQTFTVVASDGRPWPGAGVSTDAVWLGPGEKYDLLFTDGAGPIRLRDFVDRPYRGRVLGFPSLSSPPLTRSANADRPLPSRGEGTMEFPLPLRGGEGEGEGVSARAARASASGDMRRFTLFVRDGFQSMPDGSEIYVVGFTDDPAGPAKVPGPPMVVGEGDLVEVTLVNDASHGSLTAGFRLGGTPALTPALSQREKEPPSSPLPLGEAGRRPGGPRTGEGWGASRTFSLEGPESVPPGGSASYRFVAGRAGSYWYGAGADRARQMGMYGALVVNPAAGGGLLYAGGPSFEREYTMLLSEMDSGLHERERRDSEGTAELDGYAPNYFLINGLAYPDTLSDAGTMMHVNPDERVLIRAINAGQVPHAMHLHGYHFRVVGRDGSPWPDGPTKDTILIGPGEAYNLLFVADQSGLFPWHDHYEYANTNNGVWLGGMHTMVAAGVPHPLTPPTSTAVAGDLPPDSPTVLVRDNFYTPILLTVPRGTTVRWEHQGRVQHTVSSLPGFFESGPLEGGDVFTWTFQTPGRYDYFCRFHITNRGAVIVE